MGRVIGIDYGTKRVGLAVTDPLQIIASPLETIRTHLIFEFLQNYCQTENTDAFVVGMPKNLDNSDTHATKHVEGFVKKLKKTFPAQSIHLEDERFTSKQALNALIEGGTSKKFRREKGNIDKVSATIILQSYLEKKRI
ncbi:Holliday junction resolvase RuvX [Catalinimonas niigatensis]|uniref:Holliday junction resolvase RuvX n=1 Tax=Catalinimonas niigatensis TaxID=1397264 RepID=UPI00266643B3|nr:Holliday junction resolvase RuvX [Catalinimonas niigatensis]WPP48062.1 Holliday junction resolvase RuvX [Catalinimonas niigatensis]